MAFPRCVCVCTCASRCVCACVYMCVCVHVCVCGAYNFWSCSFSRSVVFDSVTPWTVAHQAPLSTGFSRQEYWSRLPFPSPGDLPDPGIEPASPALARGFFTPEHQGSPVISEVGRLIADAPSVFSPSVSSRYHSDSGEMNMHIFSLEAAAEAEAGQGWAGSSGVFSWHLRNADPASRVSCTQAGIKH